MDFFCFCAILWETKKVSFLELVFVGLKKGAADMVSDLAKCKASELRSCNFGRLNEEALLVLGDNQREVCWEIIARDGSKAILPLFLNPDFLPSPPTF